MVITPLGPNVLMDKRAWCTIALKETSVGRPKMAHDVNWASTVLNNICVLVISFLPKADGEENPTWGWTVRRIRPRVV